MHLMAHFTLLIACLVGFTSALLDRGGVNLFALDECEFLYLNNYL